MTIASWECNKVCCQPLKITKIVEPKLHFMAERIDLPGKGKGKGKVRLNEIDQISLKKEFMYNNNESIYNNNDVFDTYQIKNNNHILRKENIEKFMNTTQQLRL